MDLLETKNDLSEHRHREIHLFLRRDYLDLPLVKIWPAVHHEDLTSALLNLVGKQLW